MLEPYNAVGSSSIRSKVNLHTGCPFSTMKGTSCARTSRAAREPAEAPLHVEAEAGIEEACVVRPELATRGVVGGHLGRQRGRDAHGLVRHQEVEALWREDEAVALLAVHRVPERRGVDLASSRQVEQRGAVACAVPYLSARVAVRDRARGTGRPTGRGRRSAPARPAEEHRAPRRGPPAPRRRSAWAGRSTGAVGSASGPLGRVPGTTAARPPDTAGRGSRVPPRRSGQTGL